MAMGLEEGAQARRVFADQAAREADDIEDCGACHGRSSEDEFAPR
jgi:cytochrome c553